MTMRTVLAIVPDAAEPRTARELAALRRSGVRVTVAAFERGTGGEVDLTLGTLPMGLGPRRVWALLRALRHLTEFRHLMRRADIVLARNLDMALIAAAAALTLHHPPPLVYQCLDIHDVLTRRGAAGATARWLERRVLARTARLVISAPAYLPRHFDRQSTRLPDVLLRENRIATAAARPAAGLPHGPLRLGWVGSLRCAPSFDLLTDCARSNPNLHLVCHGTVHDHALPDFQNRLARLYNSAWRGAYRAEDLQDVYRGLDVVWAQDLWQAGGNSDWLLPNRLYEAGYFGCPVIAVAGTETADWVARHGTGWVIGDATPDALGALLAKLDPATLLARRRHILSLPAALFATDDSDAAAMVAPLARSANRHVPAPASA